MSLGHKWQWLIIEKPLSGLAFKESNPFNAYLNEKKAIKSNIHVLQHTKRQAYK